MPSILQQDQTGLATCLELPGFVRLQASHFFQHFHSSGRIQVQPNLLLLPVGALYPHNLQLVCPAKTRTKILLTQEAARNTPSHPLTNVDYQLQHSSRSFCKQVQQPSQLLLTQPQRGRAGMQFWALALAKPRQPDSHEPQVKTIAQPLYSAQQAVIVLTSAAA